MISYTPLPTFSELVHGAGVSAENGDRIAAAWARNQQHVTWLTSGTWALERAVRAVTSRPANIWFPAYFCNQPLAPIRFNGNAQLIFYPIRSDLEPDWDACRRLARSSPPALFVLVHYFGRASNGPAAREFASAHGATLVEDAAHALRPIAGIGESGDVVFYSCHKLLPVPDGCVAIARDPKALAADAHPAPAFGGRRISLWMSKRILQKMRVGEIFGRARGATRESFLDDPSSGPPRPHTAISRFSLRLLGRFDLADIAARRRENHRLLAAALADIPDARVLEISRDETPYRLLLHCTGPEIAATLYGRLRQNGLLVESWPDLPPEVVSSAVAHAGALALRRSLLLLPVHQTLNGATLALQYRRALRQ